MKVACLIETNQYSFNMKNVILFICLSVYTINISAQQSNVSISNGAKIKFESEVIEYGVIAQDANGNRELKFTNVGKEPLVISSINSSCGCLVATWPKEPIAPGKSGVIKAHYDTKRVGKFEKTFTVISNDVERPTLILKIKGEVLAAK